MPGAWVGRPVLSFSPKRYVVSNHDEFLELRENCPVNEFLGRSTEWYFSVKKNRRIP